MPALSEENDLSADGKRIRDRRIPIVECPSEVLKEEQRYAGAASKTAVSICFVVHLKELRWGGDVTSSFHG